MEPITIYRQERIRERIERDIARDRLSPSIIFHGLAGLGKERMAFHLAQALLCGEADGGACGRCRSCRKVERLTHPDVQWLYPRPGSVKEEEIERILERKGKKKFYRPAFEKNVSHGIDAIRRLRSLGGKRPYEGRVKVFIVTDADRMTVEAANAFLKLLEEPPDDTVIVLITARLHALLPTIRSRCEEIRFAALPLGELREALETDLRVDPEAADALARNSEGCLGRAVEMKARRGKDGWEDAWELFRLARAGSGAERYAYVVEGPLKKDRDRLRRALDGLISILRDRVVLDLGLGTDEVINIARCEEITAAEAIPAEGFARSVRRIEELRRFIDRNVNSSILLWRLLSDLSRHLHPTP